MPVGHCGDDCGQLLRTKQPVFDNNGQGRDTKRGYCFDLCIKFSTITDILYINFIIFTVTEHINFEYSAFCTSNFISISYKVKLD